MACPYLNQIMVELWPRQAAAGNTIWAILDCAQDERIYSTIQGTSLAHCCLFPGRIDEVLKSAAPHLIRLEFAHRVTRYLIDEGWGNQWAVFLQADVPLEDLRIHLKQFLRARDERGQRFFFRFYDPRVLQVYLPTCTPEELRVFYGPITRFVTEGEGPAMLSDFVLEGGELNERRVQLEPQLQADAQ